jgi:signal transduction histidine kinase
MTIKDTGIGIPEDKKTKIFGISGTRSKSKLILTF